jgi:hypothetical protein
MQIPNRNHLEYKKILFALSSPLFSPPSPLFSPPLDFFHMEFIRKYLLENRNHVEYKSRKMIVREEGKESAKILKERENGYLDKISAL